MSEYYISSTKYSIQERQTKKNGRVYDLIFRIITHDGDERQKKLSGFPTKTKAKEAYTEFVTKQCELVKNNPIKKRNTAKHNVTFDEAAKQYLLSLNNQNKESTIYEKHKMFDLWLYPTMRGMKLCDLTREFLLHWQDKVWSTPKNAATGEFYSHKYLSKVRMVISTFLTWCEERYPGECKNHFATIKRPKRRTNKKEMEIWTREEFEKFISVVDDTTYHAIFTMAFFTGRRSGEILALSPKDIDLEKRTITFNKSITRKTTDGSIYKVTSTKTELKSVTPICETLYKELSQYTPSEPFYFGGERPVHGNTLLRVFKQYSAKAGVKQIRVHDLRHSFVSMCIHLGAPLPVVADLIGDTIEQVTKTYAHMYVSDKQRVIDAIG